MVSTAEGVLVICPVPPALLTPASVSTKVSVFAPDQELVALAVELKFVSTPLFILLLRSVAVSPEASFKSQAPTSPVSFPTKLADIVDCISDCVLATFQTRTSEIPPVK